jgi:hypothetical protein
MYTLIVDGARLKARLSAAEAAWWRDYLSAVLKCKVEIVV